MDSQTGTAFAFARNICLRPPQWNTCFMQRPMCFCRIALCATLCIEFYTLCFCTGTLCFGSPRDVRGQVLFLCVMKACPTRHRPVLQHSTEYPSSLSVPQTPFRGRRSPPSDANVVPVARVRQGRCTGDSPGQWSGRRDRAVLRGHRRPTRGCRPKAWPRPPSSAGWGVSGRLYRCRRRVRMSPAGPGSWRLSSRRPMISRVKTAECRTK